MTNGLNWLPDPTALIGRVVVVAGATRGAGRGIAAAFGEHGATVIVSVYYDLAKVAINRLAFSLGHELAAHNATAVAVTPGWLRSEMMLDVFDVTETNWRDACDPDRHGPTAPPGFAASESPRYVGRGIAALANDPDRRRWNQRSVDSGQLAATYGVRDIDGSQPDSWGFIAASDAATTNVDPDSFR